LRRLTANTLTSKLNIHLTAYSHDYRQQRFNIGKRRTKIHDAGAQRKSAMNHRIRNISLPTRLQASQKLSI